MKASEVFNAIAKKEVDPYILGVLHGERGDKVYAVTDKQYAWLIRTLCQEFKNFDGAVSITFTEGGYSYSVNPKHKTYNAPYYIPNRKQYGATHYIIKSENIS